MKWGEQEGRSRAMQSCKGPCKGLGQGVHLEGIKQRTFWVLYSPEVLRRRGTVKSLEEASGSHGRVLKSKNGRPLRGLCPWQPWLSTVSFLLPGFPSSFPKAPYPVPLFCLHFSLFLLGTLPTLLSGWASDPEVPKIPLWGWH